MAVTVSQVIDIKSESTKYLKSYDSIRSTSELYWTRPGYRFIGWNTEPDGSGTFYVDGAIVEFTKNTTLYAMWEEDGSLPPSPSNYLQLMTGDDLELMSDGKLELNN